jgi:mono/diheme cytochrome c family protein
VTQSLIPALVLAAAAAAPTAPQAVYKAKCESCHTATGRSPLEPLNFADGKWKHGGRPADIARVIADGVPGTAMLPFRKQLTPQQITRLAAYVRAFDKSPPPRPRPRKAAGRR